MKTIVVLGMHRSATSLVARTLNSEVHMGSNLLLGRKNNIKGYYENIDIVKINEKILKDSGGSWFNPPAREDIIKVGKTYEKEIKEIVSHEITMAKKKGLQSWGFKDPRTSLTIEVWYKHLPNPQFVVCYRDIGDVALSLYKRDRTPIKKGEELAREYNKRISLFLEKFYSETK